MAKATLYTPYMATQVIKRIAQAGLTAKGVVYVLLGILAFMAAFELGGKGNGDATQSGTLQLVQDLPAGKFLLFAVAAGLFCYSIWRGIEVFRADNDKKGWTKRLRYLFSGLTYLAFAVSAVRLAGGNKSGGGDQNQNMVAELMSKPFGQLLVGLAGLILAGVGVYQIYYGVSEKYKKHAQNLSLQSSQSSLLLRSGKVGYISRGIVWLVISFLFLRAAYFSVASEAGDTSKAFRFIETSPFGSPLLGMLGLGLIAYGVFNFIRARYERFE